MFLPSISELAMVIFKQLRWIWPSWIFQASCKVRLHAELGNGHCTFLYMNKIQKFQLFSLSNFLLCELNNNRSKSELIFEMQATVLLEELNNLLPASFKLCPKSFNSRNKKKPDSKYIPGKSKFRLRFLID